MGPPRGPVYGASLVGPQRPVFFTTELERLQALGAESLALQVCGREFARRLLAPPAAQRATVGTFGCRVP